MIVINVELPAVDERGPLGLAIPVRLDDRGPVAIRDLIALAKEGATHQGYPWSDDALMDATVSVG